MKVRFTVFSVVPEGTELPHVAVVPEDGHSPAARREHVLVFEAADDELAAMLQEVMSTRTGEMRQVTGAELADHDVLVFPNEDVEGGLLASVIDDADVDGDEVRVWTADDPHGMPTTFDVNALLWVVR